MDSQRDIPAINWNHRIILGVLLTLVALTTSCASLYDPEASQEFRANILGAVSPESSFGQTLVPRRQKTNGITFWLQPQDPGATVRIDILPSPDAQAAIYSAKFQPSHGENHLHIHPALSENETSYYVRLRGIQGDTWILGRDEDAYTDGQAYHNNIPINADLAFRTTYIYDLNTLLEDIKGIGSAWRPLFAMIPLLFIPGWLILESFKLKGIFDPGERVALSIGFSLSVYPLLLLWTTVLNLRWTKSAFLVMTGGLTAIFTWRIVTSFSKRLRSPERLTRTEISFPSHFLALCFVFLASFFVRLAMVRDLAMPPWVDSIHHALITTKIVQAGAFPQNYLPHIPNEIRYYHPGYHSILAFYHWLSGLEIPEAMLILGQGLNALSVFSVYGLTKILVKDKTAGVAAALVSGLFTPLPAYYTSWGRYTQLCGLLILPAAALMLIRSSRVNTKWIWPAAITMSGLVMVHYRAAFFTGCLIVASYIGRFYQRSKGFLSDVRQLVLRAFFACLVGGLLITPWLLPALRQLLIPTATRWGPGNPVFAPLHWRYFSEALGIPALILAGMGLLWGLVQRRRFTITLFIWVTLLFLSANPGYFRVPFPPGLLNQTSIEIVLFLPIAVCAGFFISALHSWIGSFIPATARLVWQIAQVLVLFSTTIFGGKALLPLLNPETFLFREADWAGVAWIGDNLNPDETLVINPTGWGYGLYRGQDGGFWISALTNNPTIPPNVLYGFSDDQIRKVNTFVEELLPNGKDPQKIWSLLQHNGYKFIYLGTRGGVVSPHALLESPLFEVRYNNGLTWVFETVSQP